MFGLKCIIERIISAKSKNENIDKKKGTLKRVNSNNVRLISIHLIMYATESIFS